MGTTIVTVDIPPLTEMVDTSVGRLFEMGNPRDLAKTVNDLLDDSIARISMSSKGRELVLSKYTYEQNANDFITIYESIIQ